MNRKSKNNANGILLRGTVVFFLVSTLAAGFLPVWLAGARAESSPAEPASPASPSTVYLPLAMRDSPWKNTFGIESTRLFVPGDDLPDRATNLGTRWVRLNGRISWRELQPNLGDPIQWDLLAGFESELRLLQQRGFTPIVIVDDYPIWATDNTVRDDGQPTSCGPLRQDRLDEFASFSASLAERYRASEFNVHIWELGNEPDVDPNLVQPNSEFGCWGDIDDLYYGGERYGEMVIAVSQAVKAVDPEAQIWIGGLLLDEPSVAGRSGQYGLPGLFLQGILLAGAGPYFDIVPYHWHTGYWAQEVRDFDNNGFSVWDALGGGTIGKARYLRQLMEGYEEKPLFLDESGFGCPAPVGEMSWCAEPDAQFFRMQADHLVRSYTRGVTEGVSGFIWYTLNPAVWRDTELLDDNRQPRPAFLAYQQLTRQLAHAAYLAPVNYSDDIEAYAFQRRSDGLHILWAKENVTVTVSISQTNFVAAYSRDGAPLPVTPTAAGVEITIGFDPVYIVLRNP